MESGPLNPPCCADISFSQSPDRRQTAARRFKTAFSIHHGVAYAISLCDNVHVHEAAPILEPSTGDEVLIGMEDRQVSLAVRGETGGWLAVRLRGQTALEVAAALEDAARNIIGPNA